MGVVGQLYYSREENEEEIPSRILEVIHHFPRVFEEPKRLLSPRSHDHHIHLKEGSHLFKIRPHRCPFIQKTKIEKLIKEMLQTGIIQASNSVRSGRWSAGDEVQSLGQDL
ncbi:Hypothetical predicted protein [Olea europaea subsp. europaea]|uniref:Uncharacterized protein n=1 Tax=Olea europaea subsp. europaea TaxID=158383 RepID=A0A8S0QKQ1_OLEEU|nr:Hypothetical predicted protein [Olea europaea subsp. europaea]